MRASCQAVNAAFDINLFARGLPIGSVTVRATPGAGRAGRGATTLALDSGAAAALASLGVQVPPGRSGQRLRTVGSASPITGGKLDVKSFAGSARHSGGIRLSNGSIAVELTLVHHQRRFRSRPDRTGGRSACVDPEPRPAQLDAQVRGRRIASPVSGPRSRRRPPRPSTGRSRRAPSRRVCRSARQPSRPGRADARRPRLRSRGDGVAHRLWRCADRGSRTAHAQLARGHRGARGRPCRPTGSGGAWCSCTRARCAHRWEAARRCHGSPSASAATSRTSPRPLPSGTDCRTAPPGLRRRWRAHLRSSPPPVAAALAISGPR